MRTNWRGIRLLSSLLDNALIIVGLLLLCPYFSLQGFFDIPELSAESAGPGMAVAAENPKAASFFGKTKETLKQAFSPRGFIRVGGSHSHQADSDIAEESTQANPVSTREQSVLCFCVCQLSHVSRHKSSLQHAVLCRSVRYQETSRVPARMTVSAPLTRGAKAIGI